MGVPSRLKEIMQEAEVIKPSVFWSDTRARISKGQMVPFVGDAISTQHIFKGAYKAVIEGWGNDVGFPWPNRIDVTTIAQYALFKESTLAAKRSYLTWLKNQLITFAASDEENVTKTQLKMAYGKKKQDDYSLTRMAQELGYLNFDKQPNHPLHILARMPFPIYITTSYHQFLEVALDVVAKKTVTSKIYPWNADLEKKTRYADPKKLNENPFNLVPDFQPDEYHPLVYHLFGREDDPTSMVLTENDFLDFLIYVSYQTGAKTEIGGHINAQGKPVEQGLPRLIEDTIGIYSCPLLLGYELQAWDFRVLYRGLMVARAQEEEGMCIQVPLEPAINDDAAEKQEKIRENLEKYLRDTSKLKLYWGTPEKCLQELLHIFQS